MGVLLHCKEPQTDWPGICGLSLQRVHKYFLPSESALIQFISFFHVRRPTSKLQKLTDKERLQRMPFTRVLLHENVNALFNERDDEIIGTRVKPKGGAKILSIA